MTQLSLPEPAPVAVVRQRRFVITDVIHSRLATPFPSITPHSITKPERQHLANLTSIESCDLDLGEGFHIL